MLLKNIAELVSFFLVMDLNQYWNSTLKYPLKKVNTFATREPPDPSVSHTDPSVFRKHNVARTQSVGGPGPSAATFPHTRSVSLCVCVCVLLLCIRPAAAPTPAPLQRLLNSLLIAVRVLRGSATTSA